MGARRLTRVWHEWPFQLSFHTPTAAWFVPLILVLPDTSDIRVVATVVASEYRRLLIQDAEPQPFRWQ